MDWSRIYYSDLVIYPEGRGVGKFQNQNGTQLDNIVIHVFGEYILTYFFLQIYTWNISSA